MSYVVTCANGQRVWLWAEDGAQAWKIVEREMSHTTVVAVDYA